MTFYPSEKEIQELARRAREAAAKVAKRTRPAEHPEEYNAPLEYRLNREDYRLFIQLTMAYAGAEETHRPAAERYSNLKHALKVWESSGGDQGTLF